MDFLCEIMQMVKLHNTVYFHAQFQSPWGMEIPSGEFANYHIVTTGECWVSYGKERNNLLLKKGDMILFPKGNSHTLSDMPHSTCITAQEFLKNNTNNKSSKEIIFGGDGSDSCSLICGHFEYDKEFSHPLFDALPPFIHISTTDNTDASWFNTASQLATQISEGNSIGKDIIINKLAESLFIQALVIHMESLENISNFLTAIQDKSIGLSLQAMHEKIAYDWKISDLARIASMSKSVFSTRFHIMVGEPPITYLARWRMLKAREMLIDTTLPISIISQKVGYQTEYSFSKAFKKIVGNSPGQLRKIY